MLETKEQKQYFFTAIILVIILVLISAFSRSSFLYVDRTPEKKQALDYNAYLASINVNQEASQALFKEVVSKEEITFEVEKALNVKQTIKPPEIEQSRLKFSNLSGAAAVADYLKGTGQLMLNFQNKTSEINHSLFDINQNPEDIEKAITENKFLVDKFYDSLVPQEAVIFHKAFLTALLSYEDTLKIAKAYNVNPSADPWPRVYHNYVVINEEIRTANSELSRLITKYKLSDIVIQENLAHPNGHFIKTAHAIFGFGDLSITIGDIPRIARELLQDGLDAAFAQFMQRFLNNFISKIEQNYKIANFLYYTDALVRGQYVDDYLKKYVAEPIDRLMVTKFIPQFNCGQAQDVKLVLKAKADQYLGFDPETVSPSDPQFYEKMARMGNFLSSPQGWQLYYQDLADQAKSEAEKAAERELTSAGVKSPRDLIGKQISVSLTTITASLQSALQSALDLGTANPESLSSKIVSGIIETLFNRFVFKGAVFAEQGVCVPVPQLQPVLPAEAATYQEPPPTPTDDELLNRYRNNFGPRGAQP